MVKSIDKINWVRSAGTTHKVQSEIDMHGNSYIKTECGRLVSVTDTSGNIELLDDGDVTQFDMKKKNNFCYDCRPDVDFIKNYE